MENQYKSNLTDVSECISNTTNKFQTIMKSITERINHLQLLMDMRFSQGSELYNQVAKQLDQVLTEAETLCQNLKESLLRDQSIVTEVKLFLESCNHQQSNIEKLVDITSQRYNAKIPHFNEYPIFPINQTLKPT